MATSKKEDVNTDLIEKIIQKPEKIEAKNYHKKDQLCKSRAKYREGKKKTAVKVYTVIDESKYLLIQGVPQLQLEKELATLCSKYGPVASLRLVNNYPDEEQFTQTYIVKYNYLRNSIYAKKKLDDLNFMGSILHICYAPELETINETKEKLEERKRLVQTKKDLIKSKPTAMVISMNEQEDTKANKSESTNQSVDFKVDNLVRQSMIYQWTSKQKAGSLQTSYESKSEQSESTSGMIDKNQIEMEQRNKAIKLTKLTRSPNKIKWKR